MAPRWAKEGPVRPLDGSPVFGAESLLYTDEEKATQESGVLSDPEGAKPKSLDF